MTFLSEATMEKLHRLVGELEWAWVMLRARVRWAFCMHRGPLKWVGSSHPGVLCLGCGRTWPAELPPAAEQARRMVRAELERAERDALERVWRARGGVTPGDLARFRAYLGSLDALAGEGQGKRPRPPPTSTPGPGEVVSK